MSDFLKNAWDQNSVLTLITGFSYIANIISVAINIKDPANDPKNKKKRNIISSILGIVAFLLTIMLIIVTATPEPNLSTGNRTYTPKPNPASYDGDESHYFEDIDMVDEYGYLHHNGHTYLVESHTDID